MEQTQAQRAQISWELESWKKRKGSMTKTYSLANPRLRKLWNQEMYLEMVLVHSQVIEHYIKLILAGYSIKRHVLRILNESDPYSEVNLETKDDETLGVLIATLRRFTGKIPIIEKLNKFNNELRREIAHHIFDGSKEIEPLEREIKEYFDDAKGVPYSETMSGLSDALKKIDSEILEITKKDIPF